MKDNSLTFNRVSFVLTLKKHSQKVLLSINYYSPINSKAGKINFLINKPLANIIIEFQKKTLAANRFYPEEFFETPTHSK